MKQICANRVLPVPSKLYSSTMLQDFSLLLVKNCRNRCACAWSLQRADLRQVGLASAWGPVQQHSAPGLQLGSEEVRELDWVVHSLLQGCLGAFQARHIPPLHRSIIISISFIVSHVQERFYSPARCAQKRLCNQHTQHSNWQCIRYSA